MSSNFLGSKTKPIDILLIEDNEGDVLTMRRAFERIGVVSEIAVAEDGEIALEMLRNRPRPDLILIDLHLPKIDGLEVLKIVKEDAELRKIPAIVLSGSSAKADIDRSYALHANAYIVKPMRLAELDKTVAAIERFWFAAATLPRGAG